MSRRKTPLNAILADMDEIYLPDGSLKTFEIEFYTKDGTFISISKARKTGLHKMNMKRFDMKGVQEVNSSGNSIDHVYPVWIHAIRSYVSPTMKFRYGQVSR